MLLRDLRFDVSEIVLRSPQQLAPSKDPDNCYEKDLSIHIIPENIADKFSFGRDSSANGFNPGTDKNKLQRRLLFESNRTGRRVKF